MFFLRHVPSGVTGGPPLLGILSLYPFGIKEGTSSTSLAMYRSVDFAYQAHGYVNKERRFHSDVLLCRCSELIPGCKKCPQNEFLVSEKEIFGGCHYQLILAALLIYPSSILLGRVAKIAPERLF